MAEAEISDYAAEAETLAERVDWARGSELTAALEELEAVSAAAPAEAGPHATSALVRLLAKNDCGPEAAQRAVETLSRLADSTKHGQAATKNGALFLSDPKNVVVILDVLEEEQQETYTIVVALELVASLHRDHAERLRRALLDTPAGAARLLDRISDHRDAVRNAAVQLWERLTRPESVESRSSDDLRLNCAFADVFAKCYACLEDEGDSAAARACVHLVANVLNGPPTIVALFDDHGLAWLVPLLEVPPLDVAATGDEEVIGSPSTPRKQVDTEACRDARRLASAALAVLRRYLKRCDDDSRRRAWAFEDLRLSVLTLALTDDEGRVVDLEAAELYPAGLVKDPSSELWWSTLTDESAKAPSRDDVRAAALEVVLLNVRDDPQLCLSFCDAKAPTDGLSPPAFGVALGMAFKPRTFGPASIAASSLAETIWTDEGSAIAAVMFAVAPPPDAEGESAVSLLLSDLDNASALSLLRSLLARSDAVRDLALRLEGGQLFSKLLTKALTNEDALALICRWLDECSQACRALVRDPELLSKLCELDGRSKGLSCLALGLCATHFGEGDHQGWSSRKVADFVASSVGYGPFAFTAASFIVESGAGDERHKRIPSPNIHAVDTPKQSSEALCLLHMQHVCLLRLSSYPRRRALDALQEDASTSHRRRRDKGMAEDVFESDADLAQWVQGACDAARGVVTAGLVGSGDAARDEALKALQEEVQQLRAREPSVVLDDGAAAREIDQLKAEVASLRRPSVEVGAELLGKYAGDGDWYDVIVEAVTADGLISASDGAAAPSRHRRASSPGDEVVGARVRFRDYGNSEDVALSDLRAKGDDRDAIIAQLRAELAARPRSSDDALRDTELASLRAELASYKDAEQRASLLEETVASQAEEIRRLSEAKPADASAVFGAAPADAAGLFGAPPPADDGVVDELKKRIAELEANDASEALAARVAEAAQLQRRVQALEEENAAASTALQEANNNLQTERAARKANEATLLDTSTQPVVDKSRRVRRKLRKQTSNFSRTMNELFDISDSILGELQAHEEDDSGDEDERVLESLREKLPQAVESVVARKVAEVRAPLEHERDEAKKECDSAVDDLADLEERLFGAEKRLQEAEAVASQREQAVSADEDVVQALVQERDLLKERVRELDAEPAKWEERLASLEERLRDASAERDAASAEREALREEVANASTERDALRDGLRRVAEEADAGKAYEAQLEALKAQRDADRAEAVKEREASRAAYFVELEQASQKVSTLEAKLMQADQALQDARDREASLDEAVASQVDAEILRAENARLTEALASKGDDDALQQRCAELEELARSASGERDEALQKLAANDADAGAKLAEATQARDEALAAAAFAKTTAERHAQELAAASEQREALSQQCESNSAALQDAMQARDQAVSDVKSILEEFEGLRREAAAVAAERDSLKNDVDDAQRRLEEAKQAASQQLEDEKRRSATLERELDRTETESRTTLDALERRVQKVDRQAVIAEEKSAFELETLRKDVSRLKKAKAKADERCAKLENASSQREGLMKKATKEASQLSERLQHVEGQIEERSRVIEQLRADASTWERRALEAESSAKNEERELEQEALEALRSTANEDAAARLAAEAERDSLREELESMRASHEGALQDLRSACERDVTESETARRSLAEDVQAVEARVAEADRRCVGAEEAAAALSRDIDEERARVAAADALVAERDAALVALRDEVAALQSNSSDDIAVGAELSGKFSGDGQYYDVVVEEVTDTGYKVLFTEYGNSEEVPRENLRQRDNSKAITELEARCAEAEARADRAEAALLENFDESESDAGDTLQEWRERCLRAEDAYAAMQKDGSMRDKLEAQERITAELHAKLADADQRYKAELSMREEAEAVVEELQTRPRTGTALDELAADLDEVQETLAEESERRQAAEAALAAKGGWSADLDRIRDAEARAEALGRELEDARLKAAALQAELDAPSELDALAGELRAEAAVATHLADLHPEVPQQSLEKFDEEWRQLEDEHNDLLALLAQQELEKTAMAELLSSRIGPEAVVEVKEKARVDCEARYGSYVDYAQEDVNALQRAEEELEGFVASAEEVVAPVM